MHTPTTDAGLRLYDDLPPLEAVMAAWTTPGAQPEWHRAAQRLVRIHMPATADALDAGQPGLATQRWLRYGGGMAWAESVRDAMPVLAQALDRAAGMAR